MCESEASGPPMVEAVQALECRKNMHGTSLVDILCCKRTFGVAELSLDLGSAKVGEALGVTPFASIMNR